MIYVWVRRTVDWADEAAFRAQLEPSFAPRVDLWNRTFDLPFHLFRHRVREIARASLANARGTTVADWDRIPEGELVVPIDDDDWLAPEIGLVLQSRQPPGTLGWRWRASFIEVPTRPGHRLYLLRRHLLPRWPEKWFCSSNNYAIRKSPEARPLLVSHLEASRRFQHWHPAGSVEVLDRALSAINRTLASQTSLRWVAAGMSRRELLRKFRRYRRLYRRPLPAELAWALPYVEMMADLMEELTIREGARRWR